MKTTDSCASCRRPWGKDGNVDWSKVVPEEEPWCEWCGHSFEFCTCIDDLKYEEEEEWDS